MNNMNSKLTLFTSTMYLFFSSFVCIIPKTTHEQGKCACGDISAKQHYAAFCTFRDTFKIKCPVALNVYSVLSEKKNNMNLSMFYYVCYMHCGISELQCPVTAAKRFFFKYAVRISFRTYPYTNINQQF